MSTFTFETELDLNSLFKLSYNFDQLKSLIETLMKNQKETNHRLLDIEEELKEKDKKINEY